MDSPTRGGGNNFSLVGAWGLAFNLEPDAAFPETHEVQRNSESVHTHQHSPCAPGPQDTVDEEGNAQRRTSLFADFWVFS